jgi:tRNA1(Val) A37 N6-methylase TrmN6
VLVQAIKGSNAPLELRPGLVLHGAGNTFSPEAEAVLRHGAALPLRPRGKA